MELFHLRCRTQHFSLVIFLRSGQATFPGCGGSHPLKHITHFPGFGIMHRLAKNTHCIMIQVVNLDVNHCWLQHQPTGATTGNWLPTELWVADYRLIHTATNDFLHTTKCISEAIKKKKKRLSSLKTFFMKTSPSVYPNRSLLPGISQCGTSSGLYCCNVTMNTAITHLQEWFTPRAAYSCCIEVQALREHVRTATKMASLTGRPWYLMTCLG